MDLKRRHDFRKLILERRHDFRKLILERRQELDLERKQEKITPRSSISLEIETLRKKKLRLID